eukprot:2007198-Rhodomonas_salina.1
MSHHEHASESTEQCTVAIGTSTAMSTSKASTSNAIRSTCIANKIFGLAYYDRNTCENTVTRKRDTRREEEVPHEAAEGRPAQAVAADSWMGFVGAGWLDMDSNSGLGN